MSSQARKKIIKLFIAYTIRADWMPLLALEEEKLGAFIIETTAFSFLYHHMTCNSAITSFLDQRGQRAVQSSVHHRKGKITATKFLKYIPAVFLEHQVQIASLLFNVNLSFNLSHIKVLHHTKDEMLLSFQPLV
jgi:hypothetical protein